MNTSDILNKAADLIEERGWTTGTSGWPGSGRHRDGDPLCLEGGLMAVLGFSGRCVGTNSEEFEQCPSYVAVSEYLALKRDLLPCHWNDEPGRTKEEVIEVLRAAALIEAAKENSNIETKVSA